MRPSMLPILRILGIIALSMAAFTTSVVAQDDDDDTKGDDVVADSTEFVVFIYSGTVDDFSQEPVDHAGALELLSEYDDDSDDQTREIWEALSNNDDEPRPAPFYGDDDDTSLSLDELMSEPHVLVVHAGEEADEPVISAGAIEGAVEDGTLTIDLQQVDDSGYEGRAFFGPYNDDDADDDNGDDPGDTDIDREDPNQVEDDEPDQTDVVTGLWQAATDDA